MRLAVLLLAAFGMAFAGAPARAQSPTTITRELFAFPGAHVSPGSAISAGLALADRWIADEPFANPASARPYTLTLSPMLLHMSRQDLRADHRNYKETSGFFDAAGGAFSMTRGRWGLALYGYQPVVRLEDNFYITGPQAGPVSRTNSNSDVREVRAGLGVSYGSERARLGVAGEWTQRADRYERREESGDPLSPYNYVADFSGGAAGGQAGFRVSLGEGPGSWTVGGAARFMAELELTGDETVTNLGGTSTRALSAKREAGWEGGVSARYVVTDAFTTLIAAGGRGPQAIDPFGVRSGTGAELKIAGEYHDARDPWTVRFGLGQEQQTEVPEPRAGVVGLGIGWQLETTRIDFGVLHRTFKRADSPSSAEDRLLLSLAQKF